MARFAIAVNKIIQSNKEKAAESRLNGVRDIKLTTSLRKLEASSGISFPIIQRISTAKKNPALTTIVAIADGLGISEEELFKFYLQVSDQEIKDFFAQTQKSNKERKKKSPK